MVSRTTAKETGARFAPETGSFTHVPIVFGQTRDERTQIVFGARDNVGHPVTPTDYAEEIHQRYGTHGDAVPCRRSGRPPWPSRRWKGMSGPVSGAR